MSQFSSGHWGLIVTILVVTVGAVTLIEANLTTSGSLLSPSRGAWVGPLLLLLPPPPLKSI